MKVGSITIGAELETKSFEKQIQRTEEKLNRLVNSYEKAQEQSGKFKPSEEALKSLEEEIEKTTNKLVNLQEKEEKLTAKTNNINLDGIKNGVQGIQNTMSGIVKTALKWGLAVFSIRSAYMFVRRAISEISQYNEQLGTDISYIKFALASILEPVVQRIVSLVQTMLSYINYIAHAWFGVNLFARAGLKNFQKTQKAIGGSAKQAKELNKQLAGFDEMNVLQDNKSSGGGGGGGGVEMPSTDLSKIIDFSNFHPLEKLKEILQKIRDWIYSIDWQELGKTVYTKIKEFFTNTDWAGLFDGFFETLGAIFGAIGGFIVGFLREAWKDISSYFKTWIDKSHEMGGSWVEGILMGILNALYQIGKWIVDHVFTPFINGFKKAFGIASPSKVMEQMGGYLIDGLKVGLVNIWAKVKSIFDNLKTNIVNIFKQAWDSVKSGAQTGMNNLKAVFNGIPSFFQGIVNKIKSFFSNVGTTAGNVIGNTFKGVINKVLASIEKILNSPIKAINGLIKSVNEIPGVHMNKLSTFSLPRLAKGGIVNMPGRGVPIGSAIVGERGAEGVIPLTDSQQMALLGEAIGRYITVNASITNTMNGRVISRELQKINNENDFAYNR